MTRTEMIAHLLAAGEAASDAAAPGHHPFGAVLVGPDDRILMRQGNIDTVRHAESPDLARVRHRLEEDPELLARGPMAVLYGIIDEVVDEYEPVVVE